MNQTEIKNIRKRLVWRATHRGTKEVDLLLGTFAIENVETMDLELLQAFEVFMEIADPQMHLIMTKEVSLPNGLPDKLVSMLDSYVYVAKVKGA